jgi:hypothetical protein
VRETPTDAWAGRAAAAAFLFVAALPVHRLCAPHHLTMRRSSGTPAARGLGAASTPGHVRKAMKAATR